MYKLIPFCVLIQFLLFIDNTVSNEVLGCGGFIKSHAAIDFSKVEVKLFTKQGILKDSTFCAPNNGYYFLPLYDKGDYVLRVNPPTGWSLKPSEININVDGANDLCSQGKDINFVFEGFGITGQINSLGSSEGPEGIKIELYQNGKTRETYTTKGGGFYFTPVIPGNYTLKAVHPRWKFNQNTLTVHVSTGNTDLPKNSIVVTGYDVVGSVTSGGEPISGVYFVVFQGKDSKPNSVAIFDGCDTSPLTGFTANEKPLCHAQSNTEGVFVFPSLSPGNYKLIPHYQGQNINFDVQPTELEFTVNHGSVLLEKAFEVKGFSVKGRVLLSEGGNGVEGATVFVNGKAMVTTKPDGTFLLEKMNTGTYKVRVQNHDVEFEEHVVKISPNTPQLPDITASSFRVCGHVASEKSHPIAITKVGSTQLHTVHTEPGSGRFCHYLPPGNYQIEVVISDDDRNSGLQFFPLTEMIQVKSKPISGISFSQLKATLTGEVKCLRKLDCAELNVILKQTTNEGNVIGKEIITPLNDNKFQFNEIRPGYYQVSLSTNKYCWKTTKHTIHVNSATIIIPPFVQTGYTVVFQSSHGVQIVYQQPSDKNEAALPKTTVKISAGRSVHCVQQPGKYEFILHSCHLYEKPSVSYNTDDKSNEVVITAVKHASSLEVQSTENVTDLYINVESAKSSDFLVKLLPFQTYVYSDQYYYKFKLHLADQETVKLIPHSELLWFKPTVLNLLGGNDCTDYGPRITGIKGKIIQGQISPMLAGVKITVKSSASEEFVQETDEFGKYRFPPLDDSRSYAVTPEKESYVFTGPDANGNFNAHKLAEIVVEVVDQADGKPLQGTLLSLSGGESYRRNLQTDVNGVITFNSLSPSDYFLRPVMKEYSFEPNSKIINVKEGVVIKVKLSGQRVAYSAYGTVTSLSGEPEPDMVVTAIGVDSCSHLTEESTTEMNGNFRIRGLQPQCKYELSVKQSLNSDQSIEKSTPESRTINLPKEDIKDLKFIVFRPATQMDIVVRVYSPNPEYYKNIRLKLSRESTPNNPIHVMKLDSSLYKVGGPFNPGVLVCFPPLQIDNRGYFVQLESSLSQAVHNYKTEIEYFVANTSFKHFDFNFVSKADVKDENIKHMSVWILPFLLLFIVMVYNVQKIAAICSEIFSRLNANPIFVKNVPAVSDRLADEDDIDQIVQSINAVKRKVKPRKV